MIFLTICSANDELRQDAAPQLDSFFCAVVPISSHLSFSITTNTIMKYNLIVRKLLTELVLARANGR
jgi:hypothetical protein